MYVLRISPRAYVKVELNNDITITEDYTKVNKFDKIGEAMKAASEVNKALTTYAVKIFEIIN